MPLHPYQSDSVAFMRETAGAHGAALIASDMGVGKTPTLLSAPPEAAPVLVVVPASLKAQTAERVATWRPGNRVTVLDGVGAFRSPSPGECVIVNPELLPTAPRELKAMETERDLALAWELGEPVARPKLTADDYEAKIARLSARGLAARGSLARGTWCLVDEAHEYNSAKTAQTVRLRSLLAEVWRSGGKAIGATATPLVNDPAELRALLGTFRLGGAAWPAAKGRSLDYWSFLRDWGGDPGHFGETWSGQPRTEACAMALRRVSIRHNFTDACPSVPLPRAPWIIGVELTDEAQRYADEACEVLRRRMLDLAAGSGEKVAFEMVSRVRAAMAGAKLRAIMDWISEMEDAGEPAVVACVSVDTVRAVGRRKGWASITGDVSGEDRHAILGKFADGKLRGVAMTIAAGGVGTDMQVSAEMLLASREWNPAKNRQAFARIYRQGQTRAVRATVMRALHPLEDRIDELLALRRRYMAVIDASAVRARHVA